MKWFLISVLTLSIVVIELFLFWIIDERNILDSNKRLIHSELAKIEALESLDKKVQNILMHTHINVSDKTFARKKLLTFFDKYKNTFNLSLNEYFKEHNGMLYLRLKASLSDIYKLDAFLELFDKTILIEIQSMKKSDSTIEVNFNAYYPFKEYL